MSKDIIVKCDAIESVKAGSFKEPELLIDLTGVCIKSLVAEIGATELLDELDEYDVAIWLQGRGFMVIGYY